MTAKPESIQAFVSSYPPRLRMYNNALLTPVLHNSVPSNPLARTTKRGTTIINYAEDGYDDYDDDDDDRSRRPSGLRNLRREESVAKVDPGERVAKETYEPVDVQPIYRDWMGKSRWPRNDCQNYSQATLPLTLVPIRLDLDIAPHTPQPPFITQQPCDTSHPLFKPQEPAVAYRLRDTFLWNLHESSVTFDAFACALVQDLDLPGSRSSIVAEIIKQIRTQLEEYAGVALHPLFHSAPTAAPDPSKTAAAAAAPSASSTPIPNPLSASRAGTPATANAAFPQTPSKPNEQASGGDEIAATATAIPPEDDDYSPDDAYRCIVNLNINLASQVYTDKFEWSLLHPPGTAEVFAKQTCADLGLGGEWVSAMTHAIYEAVLRLKKEACESGGLVAGWGSGGASGRFEFPNDTAPSAGGDAAGWRYDPEHLCDIWEPKLETLSKEDMEKREVDRERQIRRLRRETSRFSSNTGLPTGPMGIGFGGLIEQEEERMGRGERSKKRRRFRSLSPVGRSGTPGGRGTPDVAAGGAGGYGGGGTLTENERTSWRCWHCKIWGMHVWAVRDGPHGPRTLCNNCGLLFERDRKLPRCLKNMHTHAPWPL